MRDASSVLEVAQAHERQEGEKSLEREELRLDYQTVRRQTESLCETLAAEDYVIQTMPEVSPTKWHLAHTSWFFETFILQQHVAGYRPVHPPYAFLFNSYYNAAGKMHPRAQRGLISRPTVKETFAYRKQVDTMVQEFLESCEEEQLQTIAPLIQLGLNHEQQHQELMLTDIKHVFSMNPLRPAFHEPKSAPGIRGGDWCWQDFSEDLYEIGHDGGGFS